LRIIRQHGPNAGDDRIIHGAHLLHAGAAPPRR